jgi:hypothetical protein
LALLPWLAGGLVAQSPIAIGKYFAVTCEGGDQQMAEQALKVVEPVWPLVCASFGLEEVALDEKLSVVLYRGVDGYLAADKRLTGGRFGPNQAMSHWASKSAHVAMQPPSSDASLAGCGLPMQTQVMLAWEACHIARFELCPNFRSHPGWFHDGLAATTSLRVLRQLDPQMGDQPFFTQRWWRVRRLVVAGDMPSVRALLADQTQDLDMRDRYAARIAFYEFVAATYPGKMLEVAKAVRTTPAGSSYKGKVQRVADRLLGSLGDEFIADVKRRAIMWDERIRSLWLFGSEWRQRAFASNAAVAYAAKAVLGGSFHAKGALLIYAGETQQMNFLFAESAAGFYSLAITAGSGWKLMDYRSESNEWLVVSRGEEAAMTTGSYVPFELQGTGRELTVKLAGRTWKIKLPRVLPEKVRWGVGAQSGQDGAGNGAFGIWRGVTVTGG